MQGYDKAATRRDVAALDATRLEHVAHAPLLARAPAPGDPTVLPALELGAAEADPFRNLALWWDGRARPPSGPVVVAAVATRSTGQVPVGSTEAWWAANLALALAGSGHTTLLVDARMNEAPGGGSGGAPDTPGLYDVLTGTPLEQAVSAGPGPGLSVMPPGQPGDPVDPGLLQAPFASVVQRAGRVFDAVVVLGPGLDQGDDAPVMARTGCLLLAVPAGRSGLSALRHQGARVRALDAPVAGVLLSERRRTRVGR